MALIPDLHGPIRPSEICGAVMERYGDKVNEAVKKTQETGKEHGFWMCLDLKAEMPVVQGTQEHVDGFTLIKSLRCPDQKAYGFFHTHPGVDKVPGFDDLSDTMKNEFAVVLSTPSHQDVAVGRELEALLTCVAGANDAYPKSMTCVTDHGPRTEHLARKLSYAAQLVSNVPGLQLTDGAITKAADNVVEAGKGCRIEL